MVDVKQQYEALRKKLIDTSLRNKMIAYRPATLAGVEIVGEAPAQIHRILVEDAKKMSFVGIPDPVKKATSKSGFQDALDDPDLLAELQLAAQEELNNYLNPQVITDPSYHDDAGLPGYRLADVDQTDTKLNTPHTVSNLQRRLTKLYRDSNSIREETGLNVLFLALGALHWRESESSDTERVAPLIFIPVKLERLANGQFRLTYDGGEIGANLSLAILAKEQFGLTLPLFEDDSTIDTFLRDIASRVRNQEGWSVDHSFVALGFFQFAKLVMYQDLEENKWSTESTPTSDKDIQAMLGEGYGPSEPTVGETEFIDPYRPLEECHEVYDCDSSQTLAIIRAQSGRSMVIEGPPGTGKSQTIANLIAEYIARGKKVLFVSEKMAALDVVFRRLDKAGLGDTCLELHNRASRRKDFYEELKRVMGLARQFRPATEEVNRLAKLRQDLNQYSFAINTEIEPYGLTPHQAIGIRGLLPTETEDDIPYRIDFAALKGMSWSEIQSHFPAIKALQNRIREIGLPIEHPFYQCQLKIVPPGLQLELRPLISTTIDQLKDALELATQVSMRLCLPKPQTLSDVQTMVTCAERALSAPPHDGVAIKSANWAQENESIRAVIISLENVQRLIEKQRPYVDERLWTCDVQGAHRAFVEWTPKWYRFFSGDFRSKNRELSAFLTSGAPKDPAARLAILEDVLEVQKERRFIATHEGKVREMFGIHWRGEASDPQVLTKLLEWCLETRRAVDQGEIPAGLLDFLQGTMDTGNIRDEANVASEATQRACSSFANIAQKLVFAPANGLNTPFQVQSEALERWQIGLSRLPEIQQFNIARESLIESGLEAIALTADRWPLASDRLLDLVKRSYLDGVLLEAAMTRQPIQSFVRHEHEQHIEEYKRLDETILAHNRAKVITSHLAGLPNWELAGGNLLHLRQQTELRRGHKSIRWSMEKAGGAIQMMKPVFLMSPLSVAQFLPNDLRFDVVIFDEASQIKPEDALSAILRAEQTIVVGDSKQMPPTSFFDKLSQEEDEEESEAIQILGNLESVLALMASVVRGTSRTTDLRWHYRSLHSALIRPSNACFYNNNLVVFPSPTYQVNAAEGGLGLAWHYDPTSVYDRGKSRKNAKQAESVARAALQHIQDHPKDTIGIAAFSKQQQEAIEDAIDLLRNQNPGVFEQFNSQHQHEPLFVKNLESVQGDERDVIMISVGYGRDETGYLAMNFGPINADGGERRLNVLMSRARKRCEVFSSITSGDIRLSEDTKKGVEVLKMFLHFAETGVLDDTRPTGREEDSVFEIEVAEALQREGYSLDAQVGSIGFYIDIAVRHPDQPGRYVLGIECDGASYHSARSARDRDKLRQQALEARGWKIHRIWSTDWWQDREKEIRRCREAIESALTCGDSENEMSTESVASPQDFLADGSPQDRAHQPAFAYAPWTQQFNLYGTDFADQPADKLAKCLQLIVAHEGPIHLDLLSARVKTACSVTRLSSRAKNAIQLGLNTAVRQNLISRDGDFLWDPTGQVQIRDRSAVPAEERKAEWLPPSELDLALLEIVKRSFGISPAEATNAAWRLLGYARCTPAMDEIGRLRISKLAESRQVLLENSILLPSTP